MNWTADLTDPELGPFTVNALGDDPVPAVGEYVWIDVINGVRRYYLIEKVAAGVVHASLAATDPENWR